MAGQFGQFTKNLLNCTLEMGESYDMQYTYTSVKYFFENSQAYILNSFLHDSASQPQSVW